MTRLLRSACALLFAFGTFVTFGQLVDIELELVQTHDAPYADADLTGFSTYRLYAVVANSNDFVSAVNGLEDNPLVISTTTSFWQSPFGAAIGSEINAAILGISESAAFDSWVTIGRETSSDPGNAVQPLEASGEEWVGPFEAGGDIVIDGMIGGAWFTLFSGPSENGFPDASNRVLIGQFTTDGEISGSVNVQVFANGSQENSENYTGFTFGAEAPCEATAGTLEPLFTGCIVELADEPEAFIFADFIDLPEVPEGYDVAFVLTQGTELVIVDLAPFPDFLVSEAGLYTIHTFVFPNDLDLSIVEFGVTTGFDVNSLLIQGGGELCAALDVAGAEFNVELCPPIEDCITDIPYDILDPCVQFVLNDDPFCCEAEWDNVCEASYVDCLEAEFGCISEIPYPITDPCVQETVSTDPFCCDNMWDPLCEEAYQDCLISSGPCEATAGALELVAQTCLNADGVVGAQILAQQTVLPFVPEGYVVAYVLTQGAELVIVDLGAAPEFEVTQTGLFTIHTFVYPADLDLSGVELGVTTGFDVNGLLAQGGGTLCAALDVAGAPFSIEECPAPGCTDENACNFDPEANEDDGSCEYLSCCEAEAGTIIIDSVTCVDEGGNVEAIEIEAPVVPEGYVVAYVLTEGPELVIIDLNDAPTFGGLAIGDYTIHTFVYPADLDLSIVELGVTTGVDVNSLLAQGGGTVCAALDVAGAPFSIEACPVPGCTDMNACNYNPDATEDDGSCEYLSCCEAEDGTIIIDSVTCVDEGGNVEAIEIEAPVVPEGYVVAYVLTEGPELVIIDLNDAPTFGGLAVGDYTIHTFVYPADLDLSIVEFGVTTGGDVNALLAQGGGTVCAALNVAGAPFSIEECPIVGCTDENACNYNPEANDDDFSCEYLSCCEAEAGSITIDSTTCVEEGGNVVASVVDAPNVPEGYVVAYVLTEGTGLVIIDLNADPEFSDITEGFYTIHTFVYPEDLDLSIVEFGVTTGFDINALLAQGGGTVCGALDVAGAPFDIEACEVEQIFGCTSMNACNYDPAATDDDGSCFFVGDACDDGNEDTINDTIDENCDCVGEPVNIEENFLSALRVYPNPVSNELTIDLGEHFAPVMVTMLDLSGRIVMSEQIVGRGRLNVDHLASGMYVLMLEGEGQRGEVKVMVAR